MAQKFAFYYLLTGDMFNPIYNRSVLVVFEFVFNIILVIFPLLILKDLGIFVEYFLRKVNIFHSHFFAKEALKWCLLAIGVVGAFYGTFEALKVPDVKRVEVRLPNLPFSLENYRIALLADLHVGRLMNQQWLEAVVNRTNQLEANMIVLAGDLVEGRVNEIADQVGAYRNLKAKDGVYAVLGNHEWYHGANALEQLFESLGMDVLRNEYKVIRSQGVTMAVVGYDDPGSAHVRSGVQKFSLPKNLTDIPVVLVSHRPIPQEPLGSVNLGLSGHTHGGLYTLFQPLVAWANRGFVQGLYLINDHFYWYVSPGTGLWTGMSLRLGVQSEITEIVLRRK